MTDSTRKDYQTAKAAAMRQIETGFNVRSCCLTVIWGASFAALGCTGASPVVATTTPVAAVAAPLRPATDRCAGLATAARVGLGPGVVITSAQLTTSGAPTSSQPGSIASARPREAVTEHCEVFGKADGRTGVDGQRYAIGFHLRLPTQWNGRFLFQGGGGTDGYVGDAVGFVTPGAPTALDRGFAVISTDAGHDNTRNNDPKRQGPVAFGFDYQARVDYAERSLEVTARAGKALVTAFYGRAPEHSYFVGCSNGGRQGMIFAQRFPDVFDGIVAAAPAFAVPKAGIAEAWDTQAFAALARATGLVDSTGTPQLNRTFSDADLALVAHAALEACDASDGATDGLIGDFTTCTTARVTPALTKRTCGGAKADGCLATEQVATLEARLRRALELPGRGAVLGLAVGCRRRRPAVARVEARHLRRTWVAVLDQRRSRLASDVRAIHDASDPGAQRPAGPPRLSARLRHGHRCAEDLRDFGQYPRSGWDLIAARVHRPVRVPAARREADHPARRERPDLLGQRHASLVGGREQGQRRSRRRVRPRFRRPGYDPLRRGPGDRPLRLPRGGRGLGRTRHRARPHRRDGRPHRAMAGAYPPPLPIPASRAVRGRREHRGGAELRLPLTAPYTV